MDILSISKEQGEVIVKLDSSELVELCNSLYHANKHGREGSSFYKLYGNFMLARDLSQYGHIDEFCFNRIAKCRKKMKEKSKK